ncbi:hypothetical protein GCM10023166_05510 [Paeniglutamicibacter cryotolerans]
MDMNENAGAMPTPAHEELVRRYIESLSSDDIEAIMKQAELRVQHMAHGLFLAGKPLNHDAESSLVAKAIVRELNRRAG